jgi:hypothetical protein
VFHAPFLMPVFGAIDNTNRGEPARKIFPERIFPVTNRVLPYKTAPKSAPANDETTQFLKTFIAQVLKLSRK